MTKSDSNEQKSKCLGDFNEYINLILLLMFVVVVATIICVKCCSSCKRDQKTDSEISQQPIDTIHESTTNFTII